MASQKGGLLPRVFFNAGTNVGAIIAPLTVPFIAVAFGWRLTFVLIGGLGFIWLIFGTFLYSVPDQSKYLSKEEHDYIHSDEDEKESNLSSKNYSWAGLAKYKAYLGICHR